MVTGSLTCGQPAEKPGNIGWCCEAGALCGEHFPECLCSTPCGNTCCQGEDECVEGFCKEPCQPGFHREGQNCVCDAGQVCGFGQSRSCCPDGTMCQGNRCVTPRQQDNPDTNFFENFINMINQVAGSRGGRSGQGRVTLAAPGPIDSVAGSQPSTASAPVSLAIDAHAVDPAYQSSVVAGSGSLPALATGSTRAPPPRLTLSSRRRERLRRRSRRRVRAGARRAGARPRRRRSSRRPPGRAGRAAKALRPVRAARRSRRSRRPARPRSTQRPRRWPPRASVATGEVPADLAALLTALGADAATWRASACAAELLRVRGPDRPARGRGATATIKAMAKKFGRFAKSARRSPFGTVPGIE